MPPNPAYDIKIDPAATYDSYRAILELGLENLQRAAMPDQLHNYLRTEVDHLHNIPKYLTHESLFQHAYYLCTERPAYLEQIGHPPMIDVDSILHFYQPHWDRLHDVLLPHADAINSFDLYTNFD